MKLHVLGSSSSGNCYLLLSETTGEVLAIEAGVKFNKVQQALDFDISHIVGCIISHEHGDHAKYVREFTDRFINVFMSKGTSEAIRDKNKFTHALESMARTNIGGFQVMPFPVQLMQKNRLGIS